MSKVINHSFSYSLQIHVKSIIHTLCYAHTYIYKHLITNCHNEIKNQLSCGHQPQNTAVQS